MTGKARRQTGRGRRRGDVVTDPTGVGPEKSTNSVEKFRRLSEGKKLPGTRDSRKDTEGKSSGVRRSQTHSKVGRPRYDPLSQKSTVSKNVKTHSRLRFKPTGPKHCTFLFLEL